MSVQLEFMLHITDWSVVDILNYLELNHIHLPWVVVYDSKSRVVLYIFLLVCVDGHWIHFPQLEVNLLVCL